MESEAGTLESHEGSDAARLESHEGSGPREDSEGAEDASRALKRVYRAVSRGAAIGLILRGGLSTVTALVATFRKRPHRPGRGSMSDMLADTMRWTAFLGAFGGVYVATDEALRAIVGNRGSAHWRAAAAGAAAAPTILLTGANIRHDDLGLYILLRGITLLVRCGNKASAPAWLRALLTPTRWRHGDTALMCAASWQIIYNYVMLPSSLPRSYVQFLNKMAGFHDWLVPVAKELAVRNSTAPGLAAPLKTLLGTPHEHLVSPTFCDVLHGGASCNRHFVSIVPMLTQRSLSVYIPVYFATAVAVHRAQLLLTPWPILKKLVLGCARSSCFLGVYVAMAHRAICLAAELPIAPHHLLSPQKIAVVAWLPGLATLLEKKSRRMELAFYCLCRAILTFYTSLFVYKAAPKWLLRVRTDVVMFAAAAGAIMHCYSDSYGEHRDIFRSKYLNVLDFVFGCRGLGHGAVSHRISNRELLESSLRHTRASLRNVSEGSLRLLPDTTRQLQAKAHSMPAGNE